MRSDGTAWSWSLSLPCESSTFSERAVAVYRIVGTEAELVLAAQLPTRLQAMQVAVVQTKQYVTAE